MTYKIIDNFLEQETFKEIKHKITEDDYTCWYYNLDVHDLNFKDKEQVDHEDQLWNSFFCHPVYIQGPFSKHLEIIVETFSQKFDINMWATIRAYRYPHTEKIKEYHLRKDHPFLHKSAILFFETCDAYLKMDDGTKIDNIENRIVLLEDEYYSPTTVTNIKSNTHLNLNWL